MSNVRVFGAWLLAGTLLPAAAGAHDRWESGSIGLYSNDDSRTETRNQLRHGDLQVGHDLQGSGVDADQDHYLVDTEVYHSYEAIVRSGTAPWTTGSLFCVLNALCPRFEVVLPDGTVVNTAEPDGATNHPNFGSASRLRIFGGANVLLRVTGQPGYSALEQYDIAFRDTTYLVPRFNNAGTQATLTMIQNVTDRPVFVSQQLFDESTGAHLTTVQQQVLPRGVWVVNLSTLSAAAGKAGSILVSHDGPYGALSGKAVSVEPATGFTFDTAFLPMPY